MTLNPNDVQRLEQRRHHAPHDVLSAHETDDGSTVITTIQFGARSVAVSINGRAAEPMEQVGNGIFQLTTDTFVDQYTYTVTWDDGSTSTVADPYRRLPTVGEVDLHLIGEGTHQRLWEVLGAHPLSKDDGGGVAFAVWAPHAAGVAVIGDFNGWNPHQHPMRALGSSGIWELWIPTAQPGQRYKYSITTGDGVHLDKADPMAQLAEPAPNTASIIAAPTQFEWADNAWMRTRSRFAPLAASEEPTSPMSIYELHLGSWRKGLSYRELAEQLTEYVTEMGFTHVELMGISEHPFEPSWGYQVTSYYAPNNRFGSPDDLRFLIDSLHKAGVGVIMDWVPGHFPKDAWALGRFDGEACYEHPDPRRGEQPDWGTYVFDFGRNEVRNFLVANALYWCQEFHIDGLRVDAVASMLYLDYSRDDWLPNIHGGRENLEAVNFLQEMNRTVHATCPGAVTIAEESTSWPGVTDPNGLGFSYKWNMGWMHDSLEYIQRDPIHRGHHHNEITFSMVYAYSEKYVLPISHDEVVHGKGTLWSRMPTDSSWDRAAMVRTYLAYMWAHPGKKLLFQGQEFGQVQEWNESKGLDWDNLEGWEGEYHRGLQSLTRTLNHLYTSLPALADDHTPDGFQWIANDDATNNVLSFIRRHQGQNLACVINFSGSTHENYRIGLPQAGTWKEVLNTDSHTFEGADRETGVDLVAEQISSHGFGASAAMTIPAHSARWFVANS